MKSAYRKTAVWILPLIVFSAAAALFAQDGPGAPGSATVARPRPKPGSPPPDADSPPDSTVDSAPDADVPSDSARDSTSTDKPDSDSGAASDSSDLPKIPSKLSPRAVKENNPGSEVTFQTDSSVVSLDVAVLDNKGNPIPELTRDQFRVLEDNVPQKITQFSVGEAPMTIALVIEFSARFQSLYSEGWFETLRAAFGFVQTLKPDDYVALIAFDIKSQILTDFTNDRTRIQEAMRQLSVPGFSESNMFDALADTADRMSKIEGRKAILYIGSGLDTFSRLTFDKTRRSLQESGVPVFSIETLQTMRMYAEASGQMGSIQNLDFLQGDNELRTFAKETGGQAFFPEFTREMPDIFRAISKSLRSEYSLGYSPSNQARDGKFRKITVQLVNPSTGEPLRMVDEKGKPIRYTIVTKNGYDGPRAVE